ncbi:MAG TPA: ribbon-helix-helix protein, CopG family [Terriglobales bacterium]|nr:ribbon-helix-helix protein, CopG family [Terriglobales bacterium]
MTSIRLPDHLSRELDEIAARRKTTRSTLVREAVARYCNAVREEEEDDPFLLIEDEPSYGGSGRGDLAENSEKYLRGKLSGRRHRAR